MITIEYKSLDLNKLKDKKSTIVSSQEALKDVVPIYWEDELVEYFIVNTDLNMSPGKIAAQLGHVADDIADHIHLYKNYECEKYRMYRQWKKEYNKKKIILRGKQKDLERLKEQGFYYIEDNGLTEVAPGSLTVCGLGVLWKSEAQKYIKRLQLL